MEKTEFIGEKIEKEVRKQGLSIKNFAKKISCERNNAYNIFKRSKMDISQLAIISKVLKRDFFKEISEDLELTDMNNPEKEKELRNEDAVAQFHDVIIDVLEQLGIEPVISFGRPKGLDKDIILPDFMLNICEECQITFTIGEKFKDKTKNAYRNIMSCQTFTNNAGISVDLLTFNPNNIHWIDIKLDFKTKEEWKETLEFVLENFFKR